MNKQRMTLGLLALMSLPSLAQAQQVTLTTQLANYRGDGAYLAIYLTDTTGQYQQTLWVAGTKKKHFKHLADWARGSKMKRSEYDGMTGASISHGETLQITVNLDDAFIDSGYQIRVDSAVEDLRDRPADIVAPLTTQGSGNTVYGQGYVHSFSYHL